MEIRERMDYYRVAELAEPAGYVRDGSNDLTMRARALGRSWTGNC